MFRSCDSTFGLGGIRSEEEFSWLTPSHTIEGSEDVLKSDFRFSCLESSPLKYMPDQQENSKHFSADDCNNGSSSMSYQSGFQASEGGESNGLGHLNFMNSSNAISERKNRFTPKEQNKSSYASNQLQSMERSGYSFEAPAITVEDKRGEAPNRQGYHASYSCNPKRADLVVHTSSCDPKSASKHIHHSQNGVENHSNIEGSSITTLADLDSSNVLASCCMSSGLDETSVEASSFLQLQQVMKQLDIRTKVCIRDSLYRLARSAEQRHRYAVNGGGIDDRETGGTNNCNGFMEIETNTNPIDRSIAHLLFHRPTDSSVATHDGSSLKSQTRVHGSISGPPVTTEKLACQEETAR